jgi:hypothetical protein
VLRETTSRGLCGLVCPSRTSERGGEGDCVKRCRCVCLLLQDLVQSCLHGGGGDMGGHVLPCLWAVKKNLICRTVIKCFFNEIEPERTGVNLL